jgi:hypothetical protein
MGLQLNTTNTSASTTGASALGQATPSSGASAAKSFAAPEATTDGVGISIASTALNQLSTDRNAKISRVTAEVQSGTYQTSSTATSSALVEHALSG